MSLRYKILAAVIGITVLVLALALAVVLSELIASKKEFEQFDRAIRQRTINGILRYPGEVHEPNSPFVQHEFIRDIIHVDQEEGHGEINVVKGGRGFDEEQVRTLVRRALEGVEDESGRRRTLPYTREGDAFVVPDKDDKPGPPRGGTYFLLDIPDFSPHEPLQKVYVVLLIGLVVIILVIYVAISRVVIRPIERLERAAKRVARGDYSRPVPPAGRKDEIDTLIEAFNSMMLELGSYHEDLESRVQDARRKAQAAEKTLTIAQRLAATGKLASGIAHEVNNPLAGMLNAARRLKEGTLPSREKQEEYCELIIDGLQRVKDTVKKVLQFTPHQVAPQPVALETVLRRALALAGHRIEQEGVEVVVDVTPDARVFGDPFELQQVILNLVINSLDAVAETDRKGQIHIAGTVEQGELRLRIEDNGCGMTEEQVSQAFDLFFTTKEVGEGTGLGLSIAHNVIQNHGGRMEVQSRPGDGTTVTVVLPLLNGER